MRDDPKTRQHRHVNLGLREIPEQSLPEYRQATLAHEILRLRGKKRTDAEKLRAEQSVRKQRGATRQQHAENQHAENGIQKPCPDGYREPRQRHSLGAQIDCRRRKIQRAQQGAEAEDRRACQPDIDASLRRVEKRSSHPGQRNQGQPERNQIQRGEHHLRRANLQRQQIVAEAKLRRRSQHKENHQRTVQQANRSVALGSVFKTIQERDRGIRPRTVHTKQRRENDAYKHARQGEPKILQPNRFVVGGKDVAREKRGTGGMVRAGAVVVSDHFLYRSAIGGTLNLSPYLSANPQNCKAAGGRKNFTEIASEMWRIAREACSVLFSIPQSPPRVARPDPHQTMSWLKFAAPRGVRFQHVAWAQRHRQTDACNETLLSPADAGEFLRAAVRGASEDAARNARLPDPRRRTSARRVCEARPAFAARAAARRIARQFRGGENCKVRSAGARILRRGNRRRQSGPALVRTASAAPGARTLHPA